MRIYTTSERYGQPQTQRYPFILLRADGWDDFGYKTMYQVELYLSEGEVLDVGAVKVMKRGLQQSATTIPLPSRNLRLGDDYASLGQALSYYETLIAQLPQKQVEDYLKRMRDVVADPSRVEDFQNEPGFNTSLLREGGARRALDDGPDLLHGSELDTDLRFSFTTSVGGESFTTHFRFGDSDEIPSRLNAIIGYNGVGKTRFMANLAHVAWRDQRARKIKKYGELQPDDIAFGRVVAVSFSAFDTFGTPLGAEADGRTQNREYEYCGLRDLSHGGDTTRLLSGEELADKLDKALGRIHSLERWDTLASALAPLLREPSFQLSATTLDFRDEDWLETFSELSTGHKISLNIVVQLVAQLENKSLVLMDEPESHLHPPLLAALMKGVAEALEETNSFAIIATHSPVVLQEIAARYVQVIRRYGRRTEIEQLSDETFGENIGILTRTVFNLDNAESDYEGVLRRIGATVGYDGALDIFPDGLSSQALGIVMDAEASNDDLHDSL